MNQLLEVEAIETYIGQFHILQGVSLAVPAGGCTVLLGRNGAGKSTTLRSIIGLLHPYRGAIRLAGERVDRLPPYTVARKGIAYVPEDRGVFVDLTVAENLTLALRPGVRLSARRERVLETFPDLAKRWQQKGGTLSGGQQQMLVVARALVADARLILLDEPSKGLAPLVVRELGETINRIKHQVTVLLVEQNLALAGACGDTCAVLDDGRSVHAGSMAELLGSPELQSRFLTLGKGVA